MSDLTAIFDMDGVILDSERVYQEIERNMFEELGIAVTHEEHQEFMGTAEWSMWNHISEKYNIKRSVEVLVQEERRRFIDRLEAPEGIALIEGLIPLLESLSSEGIPCWIASSSSRDIIARVIEIHDLQNYYRGYVSGDDVSKSKPSPDIFLKAAALSESDPSRCAVIEDSENGVTAGLAAGMKVIAVQHINSGNPDLTAAHLSVSGLQAINPDILRGLLV